MANQWIRLWLDMPNDPKWRTIARLSGRSISEVVAVYVHLMTSAANATERGRTQVNDEDIASALDVEIDAVSAIRTAMEGRVIDGDYLTGWEKRQPLREDDSAARSKAWREKKKLEKEPNEKRTQPNATERQDKDTDQDKEVRTLSASVPEAAKYVTRKKRVLKGVSLEAFEAFWKAFAYPKGKAEAADTWLDLNPDQTLFHTILSGARREAAARASLLASGHTPKMAQGWLSGRRWEDLVAPGTTIKFWGETASGIADRGKELGIDQAPDEAFPHFKMRVFAAAVKSGEVLDWNDGKIRPKG